MLKPDTYEIAKEHQVVGFRNGVEKRLAEIRQGDPFVIYLSRKRLFVNAGTVDGPNYIDDSPIFGEKPRYSNRVRIHLRGKDQTVDASEGLWSIEALHSKKAFPWAILITKGSFVEITQSNFDWITGQFE